jgi:hybrid cluster-associated redox disulfide protein
MKGKGKSKKKEGNKNRQINMKRKIKTNKTTKTITKDMTMSDIINKFPETSEVFMQFGLGCAFCPYAAQETLEQGALSHGLDPDMVVKVLNKAIKSRQNKT